MLTRRTAAAVGLRAEEDSAHCEDLRARISASTERLERRHVPYMGAVKNSATGYKHLKIKLPPGNYQGEAIKKGWRGPKKV